MNLNNVCTLDLGTTDVFAQVFERSRTKCILVSYQQNSENLITKQTTQRRKTWINKAKHLPRRSLFS